MAEGEWRDVVLLTLKETAPDKEKKPGEGYGMWVAARVRPDNTIFKVTVRSGRYYPSKLDGSKTIPKDGLDFYDFMDMKKPSKKLVGQVPACACGALRAQTAWDEIVALLDPKHPPVLPAPGAAVPAPEPEIEMPPW